MNIWYKRALWCGLVPLSMGTAIFVSWIFIHLCFQRNRLDGWLMLAGAGTIFFGIFAVIAGFYFLLQSILLDGEDPICRRKLIFKILILSFLLFINFPAAYFYVHCAQSILSHYVVVFVNESSQSMDKINLIQKNDEKTIETKLIEVIPARKWNYIICTIDLEGSINYSFIWNSQKRTGLINDYICKGFGERCTVILQENGEVKVQR